MAADSKPSPRDVFPFEAENPSSVPGTTNIHNGVIEAIVGHVASTVEGVARVGTEGPIPTIARLVRSTATQMASGVEAEAGRREAILDIDITVEYGHSIPDVIKRIRESVSAHLKEQVGLVAKEINIRVASIDFPDRLPSRRVE